MPDKVGIYNQDDINAINYPSALPQPYPMNIGSTILSMVLNNLSPYFVDVAATIGGTPLATIQPWSLTPVNFQFSGTAYISINKDFGSIGASSNFLNNNKQISATLYNTQSNGQPILLSPITTIQGSQITIPVNGSIDVSTMPPVTIANNQQINIGTMPAMTIANNQQINANIQNATIDTKSTDVFIPSNSLVYLGKTTVNVNNLANNGQLTNIGCYGAIGLYDGVIIQVASANGKSYTVQDYGAYSHPVNGTYIEVGYATLSNQVVGGDTSKNFQYIGYFPNPIAFDEYAIAVTNTSGATIVSDTLTVYMWAIKATMGSNLAPVQTQSVYKTQLIDIGDGTTVNWINNAAASIPAGGVSGNSYSGTFSADNAKRMQILIQITNEIGFSTANGIGCVAEIVGGLSSPLNDNNAYLLISANNGGQFDSNGFYSVDSGNLPGIVSGYPYLAVRLHISNGSTATVNSSCGANMRVNIQY